MTFIKIHTSCYASSLKIEYWLIHFPSFLQRGTTCPRQTVHLAFQCKITGTIDLDTGTLKTVKTRLITSILKMRNYSKEVCQRTKQTDADKRIPGKTESREERNKPASNTNISSVFVLNSAHTHTVALKQTHSHILHMCLRFTSTCKLGKQRVNILDFPIGALKAIKLTQT